MLDALLDLWAALVSVDLSHLKHEDGVSVAAAPEELAVVEIGVGEDHAEVGGSVGSADLQLDD